MRDETATCRFCVMNAMEAPIGFDATGQCICCRSALLRLPHEWWPNADGQRRLEQLVDRLRQEGRGKQYDAMVGLSGGLDSAYLAHVMRSRFGLRLLAVHVDGGWNSAPAVSNIERLVRTLHIDLHTHVIEWSEMRDLQLAFLRAGVLNQDFPQDHAFFATLFRTARNFGIRSFLSGVNFATEGVGVSGGGVPPSVDGRHVRAIHRRFGTRKLRRYPLMPLAEYLFMTRILRRPVIEKPLNLMPYSTEEARATLIKYYDWQDYGTKHSESRFTKFYQETYLPRKHGVDKRRLHLSSLIVSGEIDRDAALEILSRPAVTPEEGERDTRFVAKKLGVSHAEIEGLLDTPPVPHSAYPSDERWHRALIDLRSRLRGIRR